MPRPTNEPRSDSHARPRGWDTAQRMLQLILPLLFRMDVQGLGNLPAKGPAILTPNHVSWFDVVFIAAYSKTAPVTFAASKWQKVPGISFLLRHFGQAIFVHRGAPDKHALKAALAALQANQVLGIAPEGTRSHDGILRRGHDGAAWLASRSGAAIIPIAIWGHENVVGGHWLRLRRPLIHFHVGQPFNLPPESRHARIREMSVYTEMIMRRIAELLPPERRGPYA